MIAMKFSQKFVDDLCCRLKLIGAPKVTWLQVGFKPGKQLNLITLPNLRWFLFKQLFFGRNKVLLFAVLLILWTDIPIASSAEDFGVWCA